MRINSLRLQNFKKFGENIPPFVFDEHFTVIIGVNGTGKTTLLHALREACALYFMHIPDVGRVNISPDYIRREDGTYYLLQFPLIIDVKSSFLPDGKTLDCSILMEDVTHNKIDIKGDEAIYNIGKAHYESISQRKNNVDLPVICFFGTSRLGEKPAKRKLRIGREIFLEGYNEWNNISFGSYRFERWLGSYDLMIEQGKEMEGTREAFYVAVQTAVPYIKGFQFIDSELHIKLNIEGIEQDFLPLSMCSDGIQAFTSMVAELAFRCIVLNNHHGINAVKNSFGVVMIDELDLHLHPNWQRTVVGDLKKAFPNVQFMATTHSPFIVQSLKQSELINLDTNEKSSVPFTNLSIEEIAETEMGVKDMPRSKQFMEMMDTAKQYYALIEQGKNSRTDTEVAALRHRLNELEERYSDDPAFVAFLQLEKKSNGL